MVCPDQRTLSLNLMLAQEEQPIVARYSFLCRIFLPMNLSSDSDPESGTAMRHSKPIAWPLPRKERTPQGSPSLALTGSYR